MADVKVERRTEPQGRQTGTTLARRGEREIFNPFSLMRRMSEELDRAFSTSFGLPGWGLPTWGRELEEMGTWAPVVEVTERDNNLVISAELPGLSKEDVKLEVTDEGLIIQGEKKREHEERHRGYYRTERSFGHFYRMVPLPEGIDPDKANAQFKNGVLEVQFPIPESMRKRKEIPVRS